MKVVVVGLGYIGLPTAVVLARAGVEVVGVDVSDRRIASVNRGELPFVEEGLAEALVEVVDRKLLRAQKEVPAAEVYIVAVPTPLDGESRRADLSFVEAAVRQIAPRLKGGELIVLESTSPPGTTERVADIVIGIRPDLSVDGAGGRPVVSFAYCPERVLPGRIMEELVRNARIVGGLTVQAAERAKEVYSLFCEGEILLTDAKTAEMAKLVENSFRDVNIAFANELSVLCDKLGIDVWELIGLANRHPRVNILRPGPGVGGHCIAVDPWFIVSALPQESRLIQAARQVNDFQPDRVVERTLKSLAGAERPVVACLGLAFKADIDDLRESPAVVVTRKVALAAPDARVLAVEPNIGELPQELSEVPNLERANLNEALARAEVIVLLVDHREFKDVDRSLLAGKTVIDTRGLWN